MLEVLHGIFIEPLMRIYGGLFDAIPGEFGVGGRIVAFSVLLNLLLMPLYRSMELRSRSSAALRARVAQDVQRMSRHFKGRERYFYIRAVHRQHGFNPLSSVLGSADLFVQVVVFFTVFHFLSNLEALKGATFGPLHDLSQPDSLLAGVNLLPFAMTAINIGAVLTYVQERFRRVQALVLAGLFLVLLYQSPAGLLLYWITNNLFSLVRNVATRVVMQRPPGSLRQQLAALMEQR